MTKYLGLADALVKNKRPVIIALIIILAAAYNFPGIRESVLQAAGIASHEQQIETDKKLSAIEGKITGIEKTLADIHRNLLIQVITGGDFTLEERLDAYDEYAGLGFNSWVKLYYEEVLVPQTGNEMRMRHRRP